MIMNNNFYKFLVVRPTYPMYGKPPLICQSSVFAVATFFGACFFGAFFGWRSQNAKLMLRMSSLSISRKEKKKNQIEKPNQKMSRWKQNKKRQKKNLTHYHKYISVITIPPEQMPTNNQT